MRCVTIVVGVAGNVCVLASVLVVGSQVRQLVVGSSTVCLVVLCGRAVELDVSGVAAVEWRQPLVCFVVEMRRSLSARLAWLEYQP